MSAPHVYEGGGLVVCVIIIAEIVLVVSFLQSFPEFDESDRDGDDEGDDREAIQSSCDGRKDQSRDTDPSDTETGNYSAPFFCCIAAGSVGNGAGVLVLVPVVAPQGCHCDRQEQGVNDPFTQRQAERVEDDEQECETAPDHRTLPLAEEILPQELQRPIDDRILERKHDYASV